jgi:hypothetical protein
MSLSRDTAIGLRTLAGQVTQLALDLEHARESIAVLAAAVRELQAERDLLRMRLVDKVNR